MDSGRSWLVAAGCCWCNVFSYAVFRSSAVLFVNILQSMGVTREQASWPISLMGIFSCLAAAVAGILAKRIAVWKLVVSASLTGAASLAACFFVNSMPFLVLFLGLLHGTSIGFGTLFNTVISRHFSRYRAVASGIASSGYTIGGLIFPPVIQLLFDEYKFNGGFLLCGAVALHSVCGALLYRLPPEGNNQFSGAVIGDPSKPDYTNGRKTPQSFQLDILRGVETVFSPFGESDSAPKARDGQDRNEMSLERDNLLSHQSRAQRLSDSVCLEKMNVPNAKQEERQVGQERITLPSFLKLPMFYLIAFSYGQVLFNMSTYLTVIVDYGTDRNLPKWNAVLLLVFYGVGDLASRFGSGWITDKKCIKRSATMSLHFFLWAVSFLLLASTDLYPFQMLSSIIAGWSNGATSTLVPVFVMELVDAQEFSFCFGLVTLTVVIPLCTRPAIIGVFRDTLGDYQGMLFFLSACLALSALLWMWVLLKERWRERNLHQGYCNRETA
ncbi:monocarboxylate transporter 12 isoform X2 [Ixodes scapularis]|uniref:monocarboxylate transporter 12 isoform X2 n=1 Tax=Ixodes scapularis TaxID=6945 RepID=UPI001A9DB9FA|nr:monocarboxylate transporter 12 isoform X2 [Ixodes scapularis]